MAQRRSKKTPTCPKCARIEPPRIEPSAKIRVERIVRYDQLLAVLRKRVESDSTHHASAKGLKYRYSLERPIRCSLPDRQAHREGLVAQTACGLLLNFGRDCAERWIFGLDSLLAIEARTAAQDADLRAIANRPRELRAKIDDIDRRLGGLVQSYNAISDFANPLTRRMRDAADDVRRRRIDAGPRSPSWEIRGWEVWKERPRTVPLSTELAEIEQDISRERERDAKLEDAHSQLARRLRKLEDKLAPVEAWLRSAVGLFGRRNLEMLIQETGIDAEARDGALVVPGGQRHVVIDAMGWRPLVDQPSSLAAHRRRS